MSQDEIHNDSLLSSISNISVKIDHTQIDDPGFFIRNLNNSTDDHQIHCEVHIDALEDDQDIDPASLVKQIYYRYKTQHVGTEQQQQIEPWIGRAELGGLSEEASQQSYQECIKEEEKPQAQQARSRQQKAPQLTQIKTSHLSEQRRLKNQTKNIPKNYGKAIITFIEKHQAKVRSILSHHNINYEQFTYSLRQKKRVINTIADLRGMWLDDTHAKSMRVLSSLFLRKYALSYIFNSRICNYASHIKYRYRLSHAIKEPSLFKHIKDY